MSNRWGGKRGGRYEADGNLMVVDVRLVRRAHRVRQLSCPMYSSDDSRPSRLRPLIQNLQVFIVGEASTSFFAGNFYYKIQSLKIL